MKMLCILRAYTNKAVRYTRLNSNDRSRKYEKIYKKIWKDSVCNVWPENRYRLEIYLVFYKFSSKFQVHAAN